MDGERTVVEEVGGAMDELQIVQKTEAGFLALQVDANHGSRSFSKLALRQLVIRIILQTNIVYIFYLRQRAQLLGKLQGIAALHTIASIECFKSDGLHISHLWGHIGSEIEEHFSIKTLGEIAVVRSTVVDNQTAERSSTAAYIFRAGNYLNIYSQTLSRKLCERNHGRIHHQRYIFFMCHFRDGFQVSNLQLWVGQNFEKYAAGVIINGFAHGFDIGQIAQMHLYTKTTQSGNKQRISIAEEMLGCNNIFALCCQRHEGVADGRHS